MYLYSIPKDLGGNVEDLGGDAEDVVRCVLWFEIAIPELIIVPHSIELCNLSTPSRQNHEAQGILEEDPGPGVFRAV